MKVALVCIAKNEEYYIKEWVDYHKKIGFDKIFIYENDWRCQLEDEIIVKIPFDGKNKQRDAYNHFIKENYKNYNWAAFFDVDEFLVLKKHKSVKDFINDYSGYPAIGINWVLFGDNGFEKVLNDDYSVIKRFTKRESSVNQHIKTILKLNSNVTMDVHNPNVPLVNTNFNVFTGAFNKEKNDDIAQINHYFCKTKEEFILKCERGRADLLDEKRTLTDFDPHNVNEIEDFNAYNFFYKE